MTFDDFNYANTSHGKERKRLCAKEIVSEASSSKRPAFSTSSVVGRAWAIENCLPIDTAACRANYEGRVKETITTKTLASIASCKPSL
jgi:hypothetical protein